MGKRKRLTAIIMVLLALVSTTVTADNPEIHSKHWIHGYPLGTPASNDLIIRNPTSRLAEAIEVVRM